VGVTCRKRVNQACATKQIYAQECAGYENTQEKNLILFVAQGDHGIDTQSAADGNIARQECYGAE